VQASVSTLGIAIVSIITGVTGESVYGISVSGFIANMRPRILKYNRLIIANLIITVINYFCVALSLFNTSISFFVISIMISARLMNNVSIIFHGKEKLKQEIHDYCLKNYSPQLLKDLSQSLFSAVEAVDTLVMQDDYMILKEIFQAEVHKSDYSETEITSQISVTCADVFERVFRQHNSKRTNDCLCFLIDLLEISVGKEKIIAFDLWDRINEDFFMSLRDFTYEQLRVEHVHLKVRDYLYKCVTNTKITNTKYLSHYSSWVYSAIVSSNDLFLNSEKESLARVLYKSVYYEILKDSSSVDKLNIIHMSELINLHRIMIESGDCEELKEYFFEKWEFSSDNMSCCVVLLVTLMYTYYLSVCEKLVEGTDLQNNAKRILQESGKHIKYFFNHIDLKSVVSTHLHFIEDHLKWWEYMHDEEPKSCIMGYVIRDFLVFSAINKYVIEDELEEMISVIAPNNMSSLYRSYFTKEECSLLRERYNEFNSLFAVVENDYVVDEKLRTFRDICTRQYRDELIKDGEFNAITDAQLDKFKEEIRAGIENLFDGEMKLWEFNNPDPNGVQRVKNIRLSYEIISEYVFISDDCREHIVKMINASVSEYFFNVLKLNLDYKEVDYKNREQQTILINKVENLPVSVNTYLSQKDTFWGENNKHLLKEYTSKMERVKLPGLNNVYIMIDSNLIEFSLENLNIVFEKLTFDEILASPDTKVEDDVIMLNVTNDIYLPFDKEALKKHIDNTERKMSVYADIKYRINGDIVGAGIRVVRDK